MTESQKVTLFIEEKDFLQLFPRLSMTLKGLTTDVSKISNTNFKRANRERIMTDLF